MGSFQNKIRVVQIVFMGLFLFSCGLHWCWTTSYTPICYPMLFRVYMRITWDVKRILLYKASFQNNHNSSESIKGPAAKRKGVLEGHIIPHSAAEKQYFCITTRIALAWGLSTSVMQIRKKNVSSSSGQIQVKERKMYHWKCNWKEDVVW